MSLKSLPKSLILEDRYKNPPTIEIPNVSSQIIDLPSDALKTSLAIEEDDLDLFGKQTSDDSKISDSQKESEKQYQQSTEFENVGSPRIILKIAKSAIADCSEPRSPKSPKIRSAANSPNPDDSPSHKLGKIKLKLSRGGHPSIISSNDGNYDESIQWHSETSSIASTHGELKIKLAKISEAEKDEDEKPSLHKQKHKESKEVVLVFFFTIPSLDYKLFCFFTLKLLFFFCFIYLGIVDL